MRSKKFLLGLELGGSTRFLRGVDLSNAHLRGLPLQSIQAEGVSSLEAWTLKGHAFRYEVVMWSCSSWEKNMSKNRDKDKTCAHSGYVPCVCI